MRTIPASTLHTTQPLLLHGSFPAAQETALAQVVVATARSGAIFKSGGGDSGVVIVSFRFGVGAVARSAGATTARPPSGLHPTASPSSQSAPPSPFPRREGAMIKAS